MRYKDPLNIVYEEVHDFDFESLRNFVTRVQAERLLPKASPVKKRKKDDSAGQLEIDNVPNVPDEISS